MEEKEKKDCFNVLPDEILVVILSCLEVKEAVRTSLLCHRWRSLWKSSDNLDFDTKDAMLRLVHSNNKTRPDEALKYIDLVNRVLEKHEGSTVEQLRIVFDMQGCGYFITSTIDKWVDFAIVKRVERLELDLNSIYGSAKSYCTYAFPSWLLDIPLDLPSFDRLTSLCLKSVSISDADMEYFRSTCLFLEQLTVDNAASSLQNVRVSGQALKLNHLGIIYCFSVKNVEISAPNLASFKYVGPPIKMWFRNVPKLSSLSLSSDYCELFNSPFYSDLYPSRLEKLELQLRCREHSRCMSRPRKFHEFSNLHQLELRFIATEDMSLLFLSSLIGASPHLHKLTLKYNMDRSGMGAAPPVPEEESGGFKHQYLKVIEFVG